MNRKNMGKANQETKKQEKQEKTYPRPSWVPKSVSSEVELCSDCFKVVGDRSRYYLVCILGKCESGMSVGDLTERLKLRQPTVTHHLQILQSVDAVECDRQGRNCIYKLNRTAHCFEECKIPY